MFRSKHKVNRALPENYSFSTDAIIVVHILKKGPIVNIMFDGVSKLLSCAQF